jgi:protein TonB
MYANGFFEERRRSPASLATVIGLHAAAVGALVLFGTTTFVREKDRTPIVISIPNPEDPPPVPPPPPRRPNDPAPMQQSRLDRTLEPPLVSQGPTVAGPPLTPQQPVGPIGPQRIETAEVVTPHIPPPVRRAAQVDSNYADALQPPYPPNEERMQRGGRVQVRITIGANGRVTAIEQMSATSEAFWRATQRQALSRWRFRPATVDGRPIESTMTMTVTFRIPDA